SVVDAPIDFGVRINDSLWIIVANHRHRFLFTLRRSETETAAMLHRLGYGRLIHRADGLHRKGCARWRLLDSVLRFLRSNPNRFFSVWARRFRQEFSRLFRHRRLCLRRDHLDHIVLDLIASTVTPQRRRRQALAMYASAERHRK